MALQYQDVVKKDISRGIDSYSAKSNIADGYAEDLLNVDCDASGKLEKRKGYLGYYGWVPLRVEKIRHSGTSIYLTFDDSQAIDLASTGGGPLVVYGKVASADAPGGGYAGDFSTTNQCHYYSSFSLSNRDTLSSPSGTITKTADDHGATSKYIFCGLTEALNNDDTDNTQILVDETRINESTFQVDMDYTVAASSDAFFYYLEKSAVSGETYIGTIAATSYDEFVDGNVITGLDTIYLPSHPFSDDDVVRLATSGTLPEGLSTATNYYVVKVDANNIKFSTTAGGGSVVDITAAAGGGTHTVTELIQIPAATHNLSNFNIGVKCFDDTLTGGSLTEVIPASIEIDTSGNIEIELEASFSGEVVVTRTALANSVQEVVTTSTNTISITPPSAFCFYYIYYFDSGDNTYKSVIPDEITYDEATTTTTITYTVASAAETVEVYWEEANSISNVIQITDTGAISETYTCENPQLVVWGISHDGIYKSTSPKGGHVTHIDNYKSVSEERLVCGLGGNFYSAQGRSEGTNSTTYLMPSYYMVSRERVDATNSVTLCPLFDVTGSAKTRTRGLITDDTIENNRAKVTAATYVSSGVVDYTLTFDGKTGDVDSSHIDVGYDKLTVSGMANNVHSGTFTISSIQSNSATEVVLRCANSSVTNATTDETAALGRAGVFTDRFTTENKAVFVAGDTLISSAVDSDTYTTTIAAMDYTNKYVYVSGITDEIEFPDGVRVFAQRTTDVIPIGESDGSGSVTNVVRGDILNVSSETTNVRVLNINTAAELTISDLDGDGTTATVTTSVAHGLEVGNKIFIYGTSSYDGAHLITGVPSTTTLEFASTETGTNETGWIVGKTIYVDRQLTTKDGTSPDTYTVEGRWCPIEAPTYTTSNTSLVKDTYTYHLNNNDYDNQPTVRSTMVSDNMYFVNDDDEVYKYDGTNIYRASLPRWKPQLFVQFDTTTASLVKGFTVAYSTASAAGYSFRIPAPVFSTGDRIYDDTDDNIYTVVEVKEVTGVDPTAANAYDVIVTGDGVGDITNSQTGNLTLVNVYKYYARLNMIDANDNIIASAATGHNDMIVEQVSDGQIHMKLVGLPTFDNYDYDRIEIELYRTKANQSAPFYRVKREAIEFTYETKYIELDDGTPDDLLTDNELDDAHSVLLGTELGTGWAQPPRAKYLTSVDNRLAMANVKGYQTLDTTIFPTGATIAASDLAGLTFLYRLTNTDTSTTTDMINRVKYEFVNSGTTTIDPTQGITHDSTQPTFATGSAHGLTAGDWVYFFHSEQAVDNNLRYAGWYQVKSAPTSTTFTIMANPDSVAAPSDIAITSADTGTEEITTATDHGLAVGDRVYFDGSVPTGISTATKYYVIEAGSSTTFKVSSTRGGSAVNITATGTGTVTQAVDVDTFVTATTKTDVPVWLGTDGNYNQKNGNTSGSIEYMASLRLSDAINSSMRATDRSLTAFSTFTPWLIAGGGNDFNLGQVVVQCPNAISTTIECVVGTIGSAYNVFVNNVKRASSDEISAVTPLFPSRVVLSYRNFPEIVDAPAASQIDSDSVVDINSSDGQQITGIISFFGESSFGGAQLNEILVVFKERSIYLLNTATREYQKIDSRGLGCTAPYSITSTKQGIMFANESGIYRLDRNMGISYVGKMMQGKWQDDINRDSLGVAVGHHHGTKRQYKLSLPASAATVNSEVFVYNHDREGQGQEYGAWSRYDNHPATGWCNQGKNAFFASTAGSVFKVRDDGTAYDSRDDASAITTTIKLRPEDFDLPGVRKVVRAVGAHLEYDEITGLALSTDVNLEGSFASAGSITDTGAENLTLRASPPSRKGTFMQVKVEHSTIDESFILSGVSYTVARLDVRGSLSVGDKS